MEPDFGTLPARTKVESRVDKPASIGTRLARKKAKPSQKQSRDENVMGVRIALRLPPWLFLTATDEQ